MKLVSEALGLDWNAVEKRITSFIKSIVNEARVKGIVIGLSGGLDSSVTATLCVRALGSEMVSILMMPDWAVMPREDLEDAVDLVKMLDVKYTIIDIGPIYASYAEANPTHDEHDRVACGNLRARIRMTLLYFYANVYNLLVVGAGDKSEILIGYFTKWGDGATDLLPIGGLYKTQVKSLAKHLNLAQRIVNKPSSPRLWKGQLAEREIGIRYELLDLILYGLVDLEMGMDEIAKELQISINTIEKVSAMMRGSEHKRTSSPIALINKIET